MISNEDFLNAGMTLAIPPAELLRQARSAVGGVSPIFSATANLLDVMADDMELANARWKIAFPGTDMQHPAVFDAVEHLRDWTGAVDLARAILDA